MMAAVVVLVALLRSGQPPHIALHPGQNNVFGAPWRASSATVRYLGLYNTTQQCEWACLAGPSPLGSHCCAFTYHTPQFEADNPQGWARQCYAVVDGRWAPSPQANITSGRVTWPAGSAADSACSATTPGPPPPPRERHPHGTPPHGPCATDLDCGLNGNCVAGACACRPAWTGARCQTLALLPASLNAGYRGITADGKVLSSWGGSVLYSNETKLYHMFLSEFLNSCGLASWTVNSQIVHATSPDLHLPFQKVDVSAVRSSAAAEASAPIQSYFAHEPVVTRGPDGEWVMYWTGCDPSAKPPSKSACRPAFAAGAGSPLNCSALGDGSTPPGQRGTRPKSSDNTWMAWAPHPNGPWSTPVVVMSPSLNNMTGDLFCVSSLISCRDFHLLLTNSTRIRLIRRARFQHVAGDFEEW